jgi:hypothetical protein
MTPEQMAALRNHARMLSGASKDAFIPRSWLADLLSALDERDGECALLRAQIAACEATRLRSRLAELEAENARLNMKLDAACEDTTRMELAVALAKGDADLAASQAREARWQAAAKEVLRAAPEAKPLWLAPLNWALQDTRDGAEALDAIRRVPHLATCHPHGDKAAWRFYEPHHNSLSRSKEENEAECVRLGGQCALAKVFGGPPPEGR